MSDYREAWEAAIKVCRERNDEITSLRAQLASAHEVLTDVWFHFSATDDPTLRKIADAARSNLSLSDDTGKS